jgi:hypothetical protein
MKLGVRWWPEFVWFDSDQQRTAAKMIISFQGRHKKGDLLRRLKVGFVNKAVKLR